MKVNLILILIAFNSFYSTSQDLSFESVETSPASCRLYGYQNGSGQVSVSVTGGTEPMNYLWENLMTGEASTNTIWGSLNPGYYKITVTDDLGISISETIFLDSLNPIADFHAFSDGLSTLESGGYIGFAPDTIGFVNLSENFLNPLSSNLASFFWDFDGLPETILITHDVSLTPYKGFLYGGEFVVCLTTLNINGCSNTACKPIGLFGSLINLSEEEKIDAFTFVSKSNTNEIIINTTNIQEELDVRIYALSGKLVCFETMNNNTLTIPVSFNKGIYLYEISTKEGKIISNGKFNY